MSCDLARRYYLRDGSECSEEEFMRRHADRNYVQIARDQAGDRTISTVWLGCNLGALPGDLDGQRLVFGTCVLPDGDETLYATEAEAIEGHKRVVEQVRSAP